ncbi:MAG TPA: aminotransferase class I/II-fold pyridoxal phosphate-dependent enzyme, partial [Bacteroidaceae bacterium]|nr:aminotransferase class I/II-fold pyridoxal phosphate-dependent enzyme [Bacteroidaceae bacterium]
LLNSDFSLDPDRLITASDERTRLIFICSPNNPTSNLMDSNSVMQVIESMKAIIVIDEAYIDFSASRGFSEYVETYPNLVVLQTLSKAWALAGIRLGMAIADPRVIDYMTKVKYPYNVNRLTLSKALGELKNATLRSGWIKSIINERSRLKDELGYLPIVKKIYPSDANFLLVKFNNAKETYHYLLGKGIIVRDRSDVPLCEGCLRITVGTEEENNWLIEALKNKTD